MSYEGIVESDLDEDLLGNIGNSSLLKKVFESKEPYIIEDVMSHSDWERRYSTRNVASWIGIPLFFQTNVIGLITLDSYNKLQYRGARKDLLSLFSSFIANSLILSLNSERENQVSIISKKINIQPDLDSKIKTLVTEIAMALNCLRCKIFFPKYTEEGRAMLIPQSSFAISNDLIEDRSFNLHEGVIGRVFKTGKSEVIFNTKKDKDFIKSQKGEYISKSMLILSINIGNIPLAVVSADHKYVG